MLITALMISQATSASATVPAHCTAPTAKVECRMFQETGSRLSSKVCRLDKEWELLAKDAQEDMNRSVNRRSNPGNGSGN